MLRSCLVLATGLILFGCTSSHYSRDDAENNSDPQTASAKISGNGDVARMAAFAARAEYPRDLKPGSDLPVSALIRQSTGVITLINGGDKPIHDARIWLDEGAYVARVEHIPARGTVTLNRAAFYDRSGGRLADVTGPVDRLQIQPADGFYNIHGPAYQ